MTLANKMSVLFFITDCDFGKLKSKNPNG